MTPSKGQDHVTPPPTVAGTTSVVAADNNDNNNTDLNRGSWTARLALRPRERDDESLITSLEDSQQQRRGYTGKMVEVKRTVKLHTEQRPIDKPSQVEGFPMRAWSIRITMLDEQGKDIPASIFEKATYRLHPSFEKPTQVIRSPPFEIHEEGWGEFDMEIILTAVEKGGDHSIPHDLNFQNETYDSVHHITFKNPKPAFMNVLRETGPVPAMEEQANGVHHDKKPKKKNQDEESRKRKRGGVNIDMEKLADGLQKLKEEDLLEVVSMIMEHKTVDTYTKNDVEQGEFHVDLYTLPDSLLRMLWDFTSSKVEV